MESTPLTVFVNVTSTHIPYTSAGKQAIAMEEEIFNEVRFGIMETCRGLKRYMDSKRRAYRKKQRIDSLLKYAPETSKAISRLTGRDTDKVKNLFIKLIEKNMRR